VHEVVVEVLRKKEICDQFNKSKDAGYVIQILETNWYDSEESVKSMAILQWSDLKLTVRLNEILMRKLNGREASNTNLLPKEEDITIEEMHPPKVSARVVKALEDLYLQPNNEFEVIELDQDVKAVTSKESEIPAKRVKLLFSITNMPVINVKRILYTV